MTKTRLGGIKILEGRSHLISSCQGNESALSDICARLAASQVNLSSLTYVATSNKDACVTALSTEGADSFSSYFLLKLDQSRGAAVRLQSDVTLLSIFPHEQKPYVTGALMEFLAREGIRPQGLASSPSAMTVIVSAMDTEKVIDGLFEAFDFSAYRSPFDWHAAYRGQEKVLKEIICSYQEQVIKVYHIVHQPELDFWKGALPFSRLSGLGAALLEMDRQGMKLPFLVGQSGPELGLVIAFCFASVHREQAMHSLNSHLEGVGLVHETPVAMISLHGPHFGDRHGITNTLVQALQSPGIVPLAISCAVSSISVVVRSSDLDGALEALGDCFQVPGSR